MCAGQRLAPSVPPPERLVHEPPLEAWLAWLYGDTVWDMFLREVKRENRNGTQVSYLQLVHNDWDPAARTSRTKILYSFGRTDQIDRRDRAADRVAVTAARPGRGATG